MTHLFELRDVSYCYPDGRTGLDRIDLSVKAGQRLAILGANGSGKSTLLRLLDGLIFPSAGKFTAFGRGISEPLLERGDFAADFRRRVALVFQDSDIQLFSPTVLDEVAFGPLQLDMPPETAARHAEDILQLLGLTDLRDQHPHRLSGGEKKKVAIAGSLAVAPEVLLMDEPTNNLDPRTRGWLVDLLHELAEAGKTVILATHDLDLVADFAAEAVLLGENHRIVAEGPVNQIMADADLLVSENLLHEHWHDHGPLRHRHLHSRESGHRH